VSGDINQPAGVSPSCVSHHFVSVTHIREERKPFWVSSADFISTFFPPPFIVDFVASKK
jgi:hypothetical protein